jgi:hypothetical protein
MPYVLDNGYRPKAITGNLTQKFAIPERTDGSVTKSISDDGTCNPKQVTYKRTLDRQFPRR